MMKCEIIRDLLPSYIEKLTSAESNEEIEEHLKSCADCKACLSEMCADVNDPQIKAILEKNETEIKPFLKLKRRTGKIVAATVLICILFSGGLFAYSNMTWTPSSSDVDIVYEKNGDIADLIVIPKKNNTNLAISIEGSARCGVDSLATLEANHTGFFSKNPRVNAYFSYTFIDKNTVYGLDGKPYTLKDDDILKIQFKDKTLEYRIKDLYDGKTLNLD
ncbi:zf-HC2 domain-containing protein [Ihubacter sp. rT4E-8]|uniref:zf-HC2 domain-containing protein n=1 Tax=Ihubacter sp. rT4E-8 TaxID=3242369 RepID=UPI003CF97762